jgi:hypothetical protein
MCNLDVVSHSHAYKGYEYHPNKGVCYELMDLACSLGKTIEVPLVRLVIASLYAQSFVTHFWS